MSVELIIIVLAIAVASYVAVTVILRALRESTRKQDEVLFELVAENKKQYLHIGNRTIRWEEILNSVANHLGGDESSSENK